MSKYLDGKSIQDIREEGRRQTFDRMRRTQRLDAEQRARCTAEEESAKLSPAEETKQLLSQLTDKVNGIVVGSPHATTDLLDTVKRIITVLDYLIAQTSAPHISGRKEFPDGREEEHDPEEEVTGETAIKVQD